MQEITYFPLNPRSKLEWTREILFHYGNTPHINITRDSLLMFWYSPDPESGMRLTSLGLQVLQNTEYKIYDHALDANKMSSKILVLMDRKHKWPWFWHRNQLKLTDQNLSVLLELSGGNLDQAMNSST